jgi:hypothetical protein
MKPTLGPMINSKGSFHNPPAPTLARDNVGGVLVEVRRRRVLGVRGGVRTRLSAVFHLAPRTDVILIKLLIDELFETNVSLNGSIRALETEDSESGKMGDHGIRTRWIVI